MERTPQEFHTGQQDQREGDVRQEDARHGLTYGVGDRCSTEDERDDGAQKKKSLNPERVPFPNGFLSAHERGGVSRHVDLQNSMSDRRDSRSARAVSAPLVAGAGV